MEQTPVLLSDMVTDTGVQVSPAATQVD